ncbi:MAG: sulfite exporter TauE/SafE family protein [Firmicutes bacterium]|nr:sulfite exporter TauE/SafE family protein [Bacillota bacterium]
MRSGKWLLVTIITLTLFAGLGVWLSPRLDQGSTLSKVDSGLRRADEITVTVTLVNDELARRSAFRETIEKYREVTIPFIVALDTHAGDITGVNLDGKITLRDDQGIEYPAMGRPYLSTDHHNLYLVLLPRYDRKGLPIDGPDRSFEIMVRGVGLQKERVISWDLPASGAHDPRRTGNLASGLSLAVALLGGFLVLLTPCVLHVGAYYTALVTGIAAGDASGGGAGAGAGRVGLEEQPGVRSGNRSCCQSSASSGERSGAQSNSEGIRIKEIGRPKRREIFRNVLFFVGGFSVVYIGLGAVVGLAGSYLDRSLEETLGPYREMIDVMAGLLVIYFGLKVIGLPGFGFLGKARLPFRVHIPRWRYRVRPEAGRIRLLTSSMMGVSLGIGCVACVGGTVFLALLAYVGTTSWYQGVLTTGLFALGLAIPFVAAAAGADGWIEALKKRPVLRRNLGRASGLLLAGIGVLLISGKIELLEDLMLAIFGKVIFGLIG